MTLELRVRNSYVRRMKRISFFLAVTLLAAPELLRAQDAAVEEHLNKLTAQIQDLVDSKDAQNKRIEELAKLSSRLSVQIANAQICRPQISHPLLTV